MHYPIPAVLTYIQVTGKHIIETYRGVQMHLWFTINTMVGWKNKIRSDGYIYIYIYIYIIC